MVLQAYLDHFGKGQEKVADGLQERFHHMGPSTPDVPLGGGYPLTPNKEEKEWMASRDMPD